MIIDVLKIKIKDIIIQHCIFDNFVSIIQSTKILIYNLQASLTKINKSLINIFNSNKKNIYNLNITFLVSENLPVALLIENSKSFLDTSVKVIIIYK